MNKHFDVIVAGMGIVGMAHAYAAARKGMRVLVVDTDHQASGASVRNFGFITVTGQEEGKPWQYARRSVDIWRSVARQASIQIDQTGACFVAKCKESSDLLQAYARSKSGEDCSILGKNELQDMCDGNFSEEIEKALYSPHELRVNPREAIPTMRQWLTHHLGVAFQTSTHVNRIGKGRVETTQGTLHAERIYLCMGDRLGEICPEIWQKRKLQICSLQMLKLSPPGIRLPFPVLSDLSLIRYPGFADMQEAKALSDVMERKFAVHLKHGIHLIIVQDQDGSLIIGDSHAYGDQALPFQSEQVDKLLLSTFRALLPGVEAEVCERWMGSYVCAKGGIAFSEEINEGVYAIEITTGAGMSLAFGFAEEVLNHSI